MERLLTLQQVCEILGSTDPKGKCVRELRNKGILEGAKFGRRLLFTESSVENYINSQFAKQNKQIKRTR